MWLCLWLPMWLGNLTNICCTMPIFNMHRIWRVCIHIIMWPNCDTDQGPTCLVQYNSLGAYCGPHTAISVCPILEPCAPVTERSSVSSQFFGPANAWGP